MQRYVLLAGGVGGAKLADGLTRLLPPEQLTIIGNTGDDFTHMGLRICPDLDTIMYTLAGVANPETGWGRLDESWRAMSSVAQAGGPDWFRLGDLDLGIHLTRTHLLEQGELLTSVTQRLCQQLDVAHALLPMSNQPAPTLIDSEDGVLPFQDWFVRRQWQPIVRAIKLPADVRATPQVIRVLQQADVVIIAPSNPFVSIDPILNVYPIREMLADLPDLVVAVTPIIRGAALKGPAAKLMKELGVEVSAAGVAAHYADLVDLFVYDQADAGTMTGGDQALLCVNTVMRNSDDRLQLARSILDHIGTLN